MPEIFEHIDQLGRAPGRVAVATLVNTRGTTPRKEGAKMLVGEGGGVLGSVTIGGCVDAQVIEETADVLDKNRPRLLELNLGDEEAWEIGLTCGGTIEVSVEPLPPELYVKVREHAARGGHAAIVTRLDSGAKLLLLDDGTSEGTLGEAFLDERFAAEAREAMAAGLSRTLVLEGVRAFVEVIAPPAMLLVVGASHVAMPLTTLARTLGYRTVVMDGRPRFATSERFPDVDELRVGIPSEMIREYALTPSAALVLVAHDYKYDLPVLRHALGTDIGYIGMLGSARRGATILKFLSDEGVTDAQLKRVRVPIGLDLGARSAPEIALAIEPGDLHEEEAGARLARAVVGDGVEVKGYTGGQWTLTATRRGLLAIASPALTDINAHEGIAVFTLFHGQPVEPGETVAKAKVTPLVIAEQTMVTVEKASRAAGGVLSVRAFRPLTIGAVAREKLEPKQRARFETALGQKIDWFGSGLLPVRYAGASARAVAEELEALRRGGAEVLIVAGASALDPLDPVFGGLELLGARMERHGAPAHPGSLLWVARWEGLSVLGMPTCGMFSQATTFDLVFPRLLAGERIGNREIAELGHGGLLSRDM